MMHYNLSKRKFIDNVFFIYFILNIVFSISFYGIISSQFKFTYTDELIYLGIVFIWLCFFRQNKKIIFFISILFLYLIYSYIISSNKVDALLKDLIIQSKPFMSYYICFYAAPYISSRRKQILRNVCLIMYFFLLIVGCFAVVSGNVTFFMYTYFTDTGSAFSSSIIIVSLFFLYNSKFKNVDKRIFILMIILAFISAKSRFYGYFAFSCFLLLFGRRLKVKLSLKSIFFSLFVIFLIAIVAWNKIESNFISNDNDASARMALYEKSILIFKDFLPLGSGYASYGTEASRSSYSKIYDMYGMSSIWGLSRSNDSFITDTYLPSLAQFGVLGILLFILFWRNVLYKFNESKISNESISENYNSMFFLILSYLLIESIANAILTSSSGMVMMAILGLVVSDKRKISFQEKKILNQKLVNSL